MGLLVAAGRSYSPPESKEIVRVDFHDIDIISYEQSLGRILAPMKLFVGSFLLTIPNGVELKLLTETLRIVKELEG